ncbi:hypothetical protein SK128_022808 [Halocaridina rubra]|uniref:Chitin-binding type-2 domain-containing protein n=1 Tax=Halocaridina rubra TaxID=373956 RepID=A0AAN8WI54_HALRR
MEDAHVQRALFSLAALQHWASENAHDTTFIDMYSLNTKDSDYPKKGFNNIGHSTRYGYILRKKRSANNNQTSLPAPSDHMSNSNVVSNTSSSSIIPSPTRITPTLSTVTISTVPLAISTVPLTTTVTLPPSTVTVTNTVTVGVFSNTALPSSQEVPLAMTSTTVTPLDLVRNDSKATEELVQPSISVTEVSTNSSVTPSLLPLEVSSSTNNASVANTVSLQNQTAVESNLETSTSGNKTSNDTIPITSTLATVLQSNVAVTEPSVEYDNSTASSNNITAISNETALNTSIPFTTLPPGDKVTEPYVESDNFTLLSNVTTTTISSSPNVIPPEGSINASTTVVPNNSESSANSTAPIGTQAPAPTTGPFTRDNLPETNFTCKDKKLEQFYPDTEANCQVFHYCSPGFDDNQILDLKFLCTGATMFDVKTQKCENMTNVTCGEPPIDIVEVNTVATDIIPIIENTTNQTAALTPAGIDTTITTTTAEPITEVTPTEIPDIPVIREETSTPSDIEAPSTTELGALAETHTDLIDTPIEVEEFVADQSEPITDLPIELSTSAVPHPDSITQINSLSDVFTSPNDTDVSEQVSKHSSITDSENTNIETP